MLTSFLAATVRHRRIILVAEAVLAAAFVVVETRNRGLGWTLFPWLVVLGVVSLVLVFVAQKGHRPAVLTVRSDGSSFDTPVSPFPIYFCTAFLGISIANLAGAVHRVVEREELWQLDAVIVVLYLAALAIWFRAGWDHVGVRLRPDGVLDRGPSGSLFVPWEALDLHYPAWPADKGDRLRLNYAGRARVRGLVTTGRRVMTGANVDRWFLARAIHYYVTHPEQRAAIGTDAEYSRLMRALAAPAEQQA